MKDTRSLMGMTISVEVADSSVKQEDIQDVYDYFQYIDNTFSTYKTESEISQINNGKLPEKDWSEDMKTIFELSEKTKKDTKGYFDISKDGKYDPSGMVKGWAIFNAARILDKKGFANFYINAGGDIQVKGRNANGESWKVGLQNPFNIKEIIKVVELKNQAIATSGTYIRGQHIYNPHNVNEPIIDIVSLSVIGPNILEADRFATAAFAMGKQGIEFIESLPGLEGYMIDANKQATFTTGFNRFVFTS